tara:strand:+ start:15732 stop:15902 length:171 start_codon:yes stop_codon:yes gene_type:complete
MKDNTRSEPERIAKILQVLAGEVDSKLGRRGAMLKYVLELAQMEAADLAINERYQS